MKKILAVILSAMLTVSVMSGCAFFAGGKTTAELNGFSVWYVDVGQADCALVCCDGETMLIDGGNVDDSDLVADFLEKNDFTHLDYMIATHPHEDHIGGLSGAFRAAEVDRVLLSMPDYESETYSIFLEELEQEGSQTDWVQPGETFSLGSARVEVLGPIDATDDPNNMSIVVKVIYGDTSFLFMGDAETEEEKSIMEAGFDVSCDVLKVGHHGSESSSCYEFLYNSSPRYAVISVGADNSYGHPHEQTLSRLRDADVTVYRTDECGTIYCTSDGSNIDFHDVQPSNLSVIVGGRHEEIESDDEPEPEDGLEDEAVSADENENEAAAEETEQESVQDVPEVEFVREIPDEYTYVLNTNTKRFHYPDCESVDEMSEKNRAYTSQTREELLAAGYVSCGRCNP